MNYYLCGRVTGLPRADVVAKFSQAEHEVAAATRSYVYNPTRYVPEGATHQTAMLQCLHVLTHYAGYGPIRPVYALVLVDPEEGASEGMRAELACARACGVKIIELEELVRR